MNPLVPFIDPSNYVHKAAAIVQPAVVKNCAWWKQQYDELDTKHSKERGAFLASFKASGAWKESYPTFGQCCTELLELSRQRVYKLISQYEEDVLSTGVDKVKENKGKSPVFSQESDDKQMANVEKARETPAPDLQKSLPKESQILDKVGHKIPPYALTYWNRASEIQHVLSTLSDLRTTIKKANVSGDKLWCAHDTQDLLLSFDALYQSVSNFAPYAVCKKCNGMETKILCSMCHGTGLINKVTFSFNKS